MLPFSVLVKEDVHTPARRTPTSTAYPTKPLPPVIITRGEQDMAGVDTQPDRRIPSIVHKSRDAFIDYVSIIDASSCICTATVWRCNAVIELSNRLPRSLLTQLAT